MSISSPYEKINSDKHNSSSSFTNVTLSKVTLRAHKSKKKSKRSSLEMVCEEAFDQTDCVLFPNEINILQKEKSLNFNNVAKTSKNIKRKIAKEKIETQVENNLNVKEDEQMFETTNDNSFKKLKKHKKKKKHKHSESDIELDQLKSDTVVSSSYCNDKGVNKLKRISLVMDNEEANSKTDQANILILKEKEPIVDTVWNDSCKKLKKHKKKKRLEHPESCIEPEKSSEPNSYSKGKNEKIKHLKVKKTSNRTENSILNKSHEEITDILCKMDSPVLKLNAEKPLKRTFSLSQSNVDHNAEHTNIDNSDPILHSPKSFDKSNQYTKHKKLKKKHGSNSKERKNSSCNESNIIDYNLENKQLEHFQDQELDQLSEYISYLEPSNKNQVSAEMSSNLATPKKKSIDTSVCKQPSSPTCNRSPGKKLQEKETHNSYGLMSSNSTTYSKNPKNKRESSFSEVNPSPTKLSENNYSDIKKGNKSKESLVKPSPNHVHSMCSYKVFDKNSIDLVIDQVVRNINEYELPENIPIKKKKATNKNNKDININNNLLNIEENEKDLITEALKKVSSKSVKNILNESIHTDKSRTPFKPNKKHVISTNTKIIQKVKKSKSKEHTISVLNDKNEEIKCKKQKQCLSKDKLFNIDKIQQDLLAAALNSINKSPLKNKFTKPLVEEGSNKDVIGETKKKKKNKESKIHLNNKESNCALLSKIEINMPNQTISQPCTSQDIGSTINKVKADSKPHKVVVHKTNKRSSTCKIRKEKSKLHQNTKLDINKIQQKLLAAAFKKLNSVPPENPELHQGNNNGPTKGQQEKRNDNTTKSMDKITEGKHISSNQKIQAKSKINPLQDLSTKLLSAELKKRKKT